MFGEQDIPHSSQYLEISYPAEYGQLASELEGDTFRCIYGTNQSPLEALLLERKIKGPCWIDVNNARKLCSHVPILFPCCCYWACRKN